MIYASKSDGLDTVLLNCIFAFKKGFETAVLDGGLFGLNERCFFHSIALIMRKFVAVSVADAPATKAAGTAA